MRNWMKRLLAPPRFPENEEKNRVAGLLNVILLVLTAAFTFNTLIAFFFNPDWNAVVINGATVATVLILLLTLRLRFVTFTAWATVIVFWLFVTLVGFFVAGLSIIVITSLFVLVVLAGVIAGNRAMTLIAGLSLAVGGVLFYLESQGQLVPPLPGSPFINAIVSSGNLVVIVFLVGLTLRTLHQSLVDSRSANRELQDTRVDLENRVTARLRDLALAAEVGRNLTQVRDLRTLLEEAAELIRQRFDLYHVQIYLTDSVRQSLILRAGTGQAAQELLKRRYSLPITSGSINGSAALHKKPIVVTHTQNNSLFRPNPLLPETRSETAVPLLVGNQVLGVLDLQSAEAGSLTDEIVPAFEIVAGQLAIAIDNANLFEAARKAQVEVETYLQQQTRESWATYLDGINQNEKLAFTYDANAGSGDLSSGVKPISAARNALQLPITLANEAIGLIQVEAEDERHWTEEALTLVSTVAQQVAQRVENLRLLQETQRYRLEAETAVRRMTHEAWRDQLRGERSLATGFVYDQRQVRPLTGSLIPWEAAADALPPAVELPLQVRGENIGRIMLHGDISPEATEFAQVVSTRLSEHLENLRLSQQTETALGQARQRSAELDAVNRIAQAVATQLDADQLMDEIQRQLAQVVPLDSFTAGLYKANTSELAIIYVFDRLSGVKRHLPSIRLQPHMLSYKTLVHRESQLVLYTPEEVMAQKQGRAANVLADTGTTASHIFVPLLRGDEVVGVISVQSYQVNAYDERDLDLVRSVASYVATALQNAELFAEIQRRGAKEQIINAVTQHIQSTLTMEEALQTAVTELGKALKASRAQVELATDFTDSPQSAPRDASGAGAPANGTARAA